MKSITVRQAKYLVDRWNRNELPNMIRKHRDIIDNVYVAIVWDELEWIKWNGLFEKIWLQIEAEAKRIVRDLEPKSKEITEKINELSKEYWELNKKQKEKATKATEKKILEIKEKLDEVAKEYDGIYADWQKELDNYKIKVITEDNRWVKIMDINDKDYDVVEYYLHWTIDESPKESVANKYETTVDEVN